MIKVNKENINFSTEHKEQVTAYIEHTPSYERKEVCSRIFWTGGQQPSYGGYNQAAVDRGILAARS